MYYLSSRCAFIQACFTERVFVPVHSECNHIKSSMLQDNAVALCMKLCATVHVHIVLAAKSIQILGSQLKQKQCQTCFNHHFDADGGRDSSSEWLLQCAAKQ